MTEAIHGRPDTDANYSNLSVGNAAVRRMLTSRVVRTRLLESTLNDLGENFDASTFDKELLEFRHLDNNTESFEKPAFVPDNSVGKFQTVITNELILGNPTPKCVLVSGTDASPGAAWKPIDSLFPTQQPPQQPRINQWDALSIQFNDLAAKCGRIEQTCRSVAQEMDENSLSIEESKRQAGELSDAVSDHAGQLESLKAAVGRLSDHLDVLLASGAESKQQNNRLSFSQMSQAFVTHSDHGDEMRQVLEAISQIEEKVGEWAQFTDKVADTVTFVGKTVEGRETQLAGLTDHALVFSSDGQLKSCTGCTVSDEKASQLTLSDVCLRPPGGGIEPGQWLQCLSEGGEVGWRDLPLSMPQQAGQTHALVRVSHSVDHEHELEDCAAFVDDVGAVSAHGFYARSEQCVLRNTETVVGVHQETSTAVLGNQSANVAAGEGALRSLEQGSNNLAVGQDALGSCAFGKNNVAVGGSALALFTGSEQVAVGTNCLAKSTGGRGNTGAGHNCLSNNRTGHFNTAVGFDALKHAQGSANTALGAGTLMALDNGESNTCVGVGSGDAIKDGKGNTCLGDDSGPKDDCSYSISIGKGAKALNQGDFALASSSAPLKTSHEATSEDLPIISPSLYLPITLNGKRYKLALYES